MKKIILSIVLMLAALTSFSQNLESGYRGFAEAGICIGSLPDTNILGPMNANRRHLSAHVSMLTFATTVKNLNLFRFPNVPHCLCCAATT